MWEEGKHSPAWHLAETGKPAEGTVSTSLTWMDDFHMPLTLPSCVNNWSDLRNPNFRELENF